MPCRSIWTRSKRSFKTEKPGADGAARPLCPFREVPPAVARVMVAGYPMRSHRVCASSFMQKIGFAETLDSIVVTDPRYARDAYVFFISGAKVRNPAAAQALIARL